MEITGQGIIETKHYFSQHLISPREIFSTFYGHADVNYERMSGGRQMAGHFLTEMLNSDKEWIDQTNKKIIYLMSPLLQVKCQG